MISKNKISLILPCRNEGSHLPEVMKLVPSYVDEIIVVSNKSSDDTVAIGRTLSSADPRIKIIEDNRTLNGIGYGYAHMTGIESATGDIIIGADGDGTYPLDQIKNIVNLLTHEQYDFLSCNRYPLKDGTSIPFKLRFGVGLLNWEVKLLYGMPIKDILSGMWVFKATIRDELSLTMGDWNLSPQIKLNASRNTNIKFAEHSIAQASRLGETKQSYFQTGMSHALWILKNRFQA